MRMWERIMANVLDSILLHEGFEPKPYIDPLAHKKIPADEFEIIKNNWHLLTPTFGHGLTYITETESTVIVQGRINDITVDLHMQEWSFRDAHVAVKNVLIEMAYQMGVDGVLKFKKMWNAIEKRNYKEAAKEMRDSMWYNQTPHRAEELAQIVENVD